MKGRNEQLIFISLGRKHPFLENSRRLFGTWSSGTSSEGCQVCLFSRTPPTHKPSPMLPLGKMAEGWKGISVGLTCDGTSCVKLEVMSYNALGFSWNSVVWIWSFGRILDCCPDMVILAPNHVGIHSRARHWNIPAAWNFSWTGRGRFLCPPLDIFDNSILHDLCCIQAFYFSTLLCLKRNMGLIGGEGEFIYLKCA